MMHKQSFFYGNPGVDPLTDEERESLLKSQDVVQFSYVNHKGETAVRRVIPHGLTFRETEWHPGRQWILEAFDIDKSDNRSFAMKDISDWSVL